MQPVQALLAQPWGATAADAEASKPGAFNPAECDQVAHRVAKSAALLDWTSLRRRVQEAETHVADKGPGREVTILPGKAGGSKPLSDSTGVGLRVAALHRGLTACCRCCNSPPRPRTERVSRLLRCKPN